MGSSPRAVSNQRKGSRFPARPLNRPRGFEPGTSSFRGGRFCPLCSVDAPSVSHYYSPLQDEVPHSAECACYSFGQDSSVLRSVLALQASAYRKILRQRALGLPSEPRLSREGSAAASLVHAVPGIRSAISTVYLTSVVFPQRCSLLLAFSD